MEETASISLSVIGHESVIVLRAPVRSPDYTLRDSPPRHAWIEQAVRIRMADVAVKPRRLGVPARPLARTPCTPTKEHRGKKDDDRLHYAPIRPCVRSASRMAAILWVRTTAVSGTPPLMLVLLNVPIEVPHPVALAPTT